MSTIRLVHFFVALAALIPAGASKADDNPFAKHGKLRVAKSRTHLEHTDGTPFFFLADTVWSGPALSTEADWKLFLENRKKKGFTAIQFNCLSPWRAAPTDREGRVAFTIADGKLLPNEDFFRQLDARIKAINDMGMLAVPVLAWAHKKGDAGFDLSEAHAAAIVKFQLNRYKDANALFILAGDARYNATDADKWKRIGRLVFADFPDALVTTHPTGMNFPWKDWDNEKWLNILGYQSGHGDDAKTLAWIHSGPAAAYGQQKELTRPLINLEPPYEGHNGYQSKKPHDAYNVRRATYWSLLVAPVAGVTYGGHGVWSWHTKPGEPPTDHLGSGAAKVWKEAMDLPGAAEMGYVRKLFESVPWTELRPAQDLVTQVSKEPAHFVAAAATPDRKVKVFYLPAGDRKTRAPIQPAVGEELTWFNPRTGEFTKNADVVRTAGQTAFDPPNNQDWVLVMRKK